MKKLILSALVLALTGGAAMADRGHGGGRPQSGRSSGGVTVHNNGGFHGGAVHENRGWNRGGGTVVHENRENRGWNRGGGVVVNQNRGWRGEPRYYHNRGHVRANIWMPRPVIRTHYYHYGYRPSLLVEDYGVRDGYIFVRGGWQWNGYEWIWQSGHYEPDPAFVDVY
ncbi:MAG: hypothetical protein ABI437_06260 [Kofleriaceae bacterium]